MRNKNYNPKTIHKPVAKYAHGVEASARARWLYISGQVGINAKGKLAPGFKGQCDRAWRNLAAILKEADMGIEDLVKVNTYLTRPQDVAAYRQVRDRHQGRARPASTLVVISQLVNPDLLVEIEAVAAKD